MPTFARLSKAERSALMARITKINTKPELVVRRLTHAMGYRYRLHRRDLPGTPDLAFPGRKKVIYVHGCFWHRHDCPAGRKRPNKNIHYWWPKLERNQQRDQENQAELLRKGWDYLIVWECELKDLDHLQTRISTFLGS